MPSSNHHPRARVTYVVIGSAWTAALLVGTGWALVGTLPILILGVAVIIGRRRWLLTLPFAIALAVSQAIALVL